MFFFPAWNFSLVPMAICMCFGSFVQAVMLFDLR